MGPGAAPPLARPGDVAAFWALFDRWFDSCVDVAWQVLHDADAAAGVAQDAFFAAWHARTARTPPAEAGAWAVRASRDGALGRLAQARHQSPGAEPWPSSGAGAVTSDRDRDAGADLVRATFAALGEADASVLDLHLRHGFSVTELGQALGVPRHDAQELVLRLNRRLGRALRAWALWPASRPGGTGGCAELRAAFEAAGVRTFGPEAVAETARHTKTCARCQDRQRLADSAEALYAAAPVVPAGTLLAEATAKALTDRGVPPPDAASPASDAAGGADRPSPPPVAGPSVAPPADPDPPPHSGRGGPVAAAAPDAASPAPLPPSPASRPDRGCRRAGRVEPGGRPRPDGSGPPPGPDGRRDGHGAGARRRPRGSGRPLLRPGGKGRSATIRPEGPRRGPRRRRRPGPQRGGGLRTVRQRRRRRRGDRHDERPARHQGAPIDRARDLDDHGLHHHDRGDRTHHHGRPRRADHRDHGAGPAPAPASPVTTIAGAPPEVTDFSVASVTLGRPCAADQRRITLSWQVARADSVRLSGVGAPAGALPATGQGTACRASGPPVTYTLTASGPGGTQTATLQA